MNEIVAITAHEASGPVGQAISVLSDEWKEVFDQAPK